MTWNGLTIHTDGADDITFSGGEGVGCVGDMRPMAWLALTALAQTDVAERLMARARAHAGIAPLRGAQRREGNAPVQKAA